MRKCLDVFFMTIFAVFLLQAAAGAAGPVGRYFPLSGDMEISGDFKEMPSDNTVNLIAIKSPANYLSFSEKDIFYISSTQPGNDGSYAFVFHPGEEYKNLNIYIKSENKYEPVEIFKFEDPGYTAAFTGAKIYLSNDVLSVGSEAEIEAKAFGENGEELCIESCEFYTDNSDCVEISGNRILGLHAGNANVYARVTVYEKTIETAPICISVRKDNEVTEIIGVTMKKDGEILDIVGDISDADSAVFAFNTAAVIKGMEMLDLKTGEKSILEGEFNSSSKSFTVRFEEELGYGKYKFLPITEDGSYISPIIEGCDFNFGIPQETAPGCTYLLNFTLYNYRGYSIPISDVMLSGDSVNEGQFMPVQPGIHTISASFSYNGIEKNVRETVCVEDVQTIIPRVKKLCMEVGETQKLNFYAIGSGGGMLTVTPEFSSSNERKISVLEDGTLNAKQQGTADITIKCGEAFAKVKIYVGIEGNKDISAGNMIAVPAKMEVGEQQNAYVGDYSLTGVETKSEGIFTSDNENVIKIINGNIVEAVGCGTAVISTKIGDHTLKKKISVGSSVAVSAELEMKSSSLPLGKYDTPKLVINSNEYLSYGEYTLYSENPDVIAVSDNLIYAKSVGRSDIYAVLADGTITKPVNITAFEPCGGYLIDKMENMDHIFFMDSDLKLSKNGIMSKTAKVEPLSFIYRLGGDIHDFIIYDYICNPSYESEDVHVYVSVDNDTYTEVSGIKRIKGQQINGWGTDALVCKDIPSGMRYLKIEINNLQAAQATIISGVEIGYSSVPEVIDFKVIDDCKEDEIYKNILGRKAVITFNQPINPDTLNNILLSEGEISNPYYDADLCRYEFVINDKSYDDFTLAITGVSDYTGRENNPFTASISALSGKYAVTGHVIYEVGEKLLAQRVILKNDTLFYKQYAVISADYDSNGRLIACKTIAEGNISPTETSYVFAACNPNSKLFIWETLSSMKPVEQND